MSSDRDYLTHQLLRGVSADIAASLGELKAEIAAARDAFKSKIRSLRADADIAASLGELKAEIAAARDASKSKIRSLRADVASDLIAVEARQAEQHKQTREQIVGLRRAVMEYHTTVVGHGVLVS